MIIEIILFLYVILAVWLLYKYFMYIRWPVVDGVVTDVICGVSTKSSVRSPRAYRVIKYLAVYEGREFKCFKQSYWMRDAFSPKLNVGDILKVSICDKDPKSSCPYRPVRELFITLSMITLIMICVFILWWGLVVMA